VQALVEECGKESGRDLGAIEKLCGDTAALVRSAAPDAALLSPSDLVGDWRLVWVSDDDALCLVGSGLHKLPLTLMEDIFMSFTATGKAKAASLKVETAEILRVLGPFPNVRNTLAGTWSTSGGATGAKKGSGGMGGMGGGSSGNGNIQGQLELVYDAMTDGNGGTIKAPDGSETRRVCIDTAYANADTLLLLNDAVGAGGSGPQVLLFAKEADLDGAFKALRVDRPDDWDQPSTKTGGFKLPWDKA